MTMPCTKFEYPKCQFFILFLVLFNQANCLNFNYTSIPADGQEVYNLFKFIKDSSFAHSALQVTYDYQGFPITNISGRVLNKKPFKLGSFNTTFVLNIKQISDPGGEGLAFVLTNNSSFIPDNSHGQWLGIVNKTMNGTSTNYPIVAVEFDTKKSYDEDLDDNHVGVDINTIYSENQVPLNRVGVNISSATDITAVIKYDGIGNWLNVFVFYSNDTSGSNTVVPVISMPLNLSIYLPKTVYFGFSASTGIGTELNCIKAWSFNGDDVDPPKIDPPNADPPSVDHYVHLKWLWIIMCLCGGFVILIVVGYVYRRMKKSREDLESREPWFEHEIGIQSIGPKKCKLNELKSATDNFKDKNELGRGGFGVVYKGTLNGEEVAVKRIWSNGQQGRKNMVAEVTTIASVHHKNVVKLIGWCYEGDELLLVYEYMPNGSLDKHLYSEGGLIQSTLSWERRYNIVRGVAQSIDYLHNECSKRVLHRDIKTSNIMLDAEFNACLGDFGLARMFKLTEKTHHTTIEIAGTRAYMAPELFHTGKATTESDVYAFGVLTLEVICGRKPGTQSPNGELSNSIVEWIWGLYGLSMICSAVDPKLKGNYDAEEVECVLLVGLACCHPNPYMRPSIRSALQALMGDALPPSVPYEKPAFVWPASPPSLTRELDRSFSGGMLSSFGSLSGRCMY